MKETCSCGAKIEVDGDNAMEALESWRKRHQQCLEARTARTLLGRPPMAPLPPPPAPIWIVPPVAPGYSQWWWQNPVVCSSNTADVHIHNNLPERSAQAR